MAELRGVDVLQNEIEKSKDKLKGYNENIKKLTGRDPYRPGVRRFLSGERPNEEDGFQHRASRGRGRLFGMARRTIMDDNGPPTKRRVIGGAFSRLGPVPMRTRTVEQEESPDEEELPHKLSVHSSVVSTSREAKNREEIMQEQTKDKEGMQRNRRMFGLLLGTLNSFKRESKTLETKDVRRKKIEEKLEEKAERERKKFKQETKLLMEEMHLEQSKISRLEQKMEMVQEHADREAEMMKLKNFIVTKTKPKIFWKPVQMSTAADNRIKESKKFVDDLLQEGKDRLDKEILELMERETKREERIKMRLREDGLLCDEDGQKEGNDRDMVKEESVERVVFETNDVIENQGTDDEKLEGIDVEEPKKTRTVVIETESRQVLEDTDAKNDAEADIEFEEEEQRKGSSEEHIGKSGREGDYAGKQSSQRKSGTEERKNSVERGERRKSGEKREQEAEKLRYKENRNHHRVERSEKKDKHRNRDRVSEREEEVDRRKYRSENSKKSQGEKRSQAKDKRRNNKNASSSDDDDERPVKIKKERESDNADSFSKKNTRISNSDDEDDNDDVVVKEERMLQLKRGEKADNTGKEVKTQGDGKPEN
ncbi:hypothetical protein EGW08_013377 [Elysia chlorotica]|uniref:Pinin n=1 Tax=Elysia chlorotica TaxID=188477 RepID=A0A3S1BED9_ELYCH|nr:hypothetical protein EGW08_013377 [Elysia chlorotica]